MTVLTAVGDLMFHGWIREQAETSGDPGWSLRAVQPALSAGDVLFGTFESPVSVARRPQPGVKPHRFSMPGIGRALRDVGFDVVNLANNHLYDFGEEGARSTFEALEPAGVRCLGVGRTSLDARRPVVVETADGARLGFLGYTTAHMAVDPSHAFVACFPAPSVVRDDVSALRRSVDAVVVSCHTGAQFNPYPSPETREIARVATQAGASVFLGHHPHVAQGWERIGDGLAVYSLGNFVAPSRRAQTRRTFFVRVVLDGARVSLHEIVPCYIGDDGRTLVAEGDLARDIGAEIDRLSDAIADGRSDDLHFDVATARAGSQYAAAWWHELRHAGPGAILRKVRNFRSYHVALMARMLTGTRRGRQ